MKKQITFAWLLLMTAPLPFISNTVRAVETKENTSFDEFDDFDIDQLEEALAQTDLIGQELVKPPSNLVVWIRRLTSPIGVAVIKVADFFRDIW